MNARKWKWKESGMQQFCDLNNTRPDCNDYCKANQGVNQGNPNLINITGRITKQPCWIVIIIKLHISIYEIKML